MKVLRLGGKRGGEALVDDAVYVWASDVRWCQNAAGYVVRRSGKDVIYLHRVILGLSKGDGIKTDHENGNKLDNRRENLRLATDALNKQNVRSIGRTSRFRGVSYTSRNQSRPWVAQVQIDGRNHHLGYHAEEVSAAKAAEAFRRRHMPYAKPDPELEGL